MDGLLEDPANIHQELAWFVPLPGLNDEGFDRVVIVIAYPVPDYFIVSESVIGVQVGIDVMLLDLVSLELCHQCCQFGTIL